MKRLITNLFISAALFIIAAIICFVLTPFWWKLENLAGLELAGHSGPNEFLLFSFAGFFGAITFLILTYLQLNKRSGKK